MKKLIKSSESSYARYDLQGIDYRSDKFKLILDNWVNDSLSLDTRSFGHKSCPFVFSKVRSYVNDLYSYEKELEINVSAGADLNSIDPSRICVPKSYRPDKIFKYSYTKQYQSEEMYLGFPSIIISIRCSCENYVIKNINRIDVTFYYNVYTKSNEELIGRGSTSVNATNLESLNRYVYRLIETGFEENYTKLREAVKNPKSGSATERVLDEDLLNQILNEASDELGLDYEGDIHQISFFDMDSDEEDSMLFSLTNEEFDETMTQLYQESKSKSDFKSKVVDYLSMYT